MSILDEFNRHIRMVDTCTNRVQDALARDKEKVARVHAELSRSHATSAMALAIAMTGNPSQIAVEGTGQ